MQVGQFSPIQRRTVCTDDAKFVVVVHAAHSTAHLSQPTAGDGGIDLITVGGAHLQEESNLFGEQLAQHIAGLDRKLDAPATGKGHLCHGGQKSSIGPIMAGQQQVGVDQLLSKGKERSQGSGIHIGNVTAVTVEHLIEARAPQSVAAGSQVNQEKLRIRARFEIWSHDAAHVLHRSEGRHNQTHGGRYRMITTVPIFPDGAHGQRVLADGNGDTQLRAELEPHRLNGTE